MALNWLTLLVYVELPGPNWSKIQTVRNFHWISIFRFLQTCREYQMLVWKCQLISKVMLVSSWRNIRAWAYYKIASFSTLPKFGSGFCHADCFHGNGNKPSIFVRESQKVENKQVWFECHIIKYLSTSIAELYWIMLALFRLCTDLAGHCPYCHNLGPIFPITALTFN